MPFHGSLKLVCATTLALLVMFVGAATAPARTLSATASSESAGSLVFRVGNVAPAEVRAARLKLGRSARRLSLRRVRAGLRRGVVRIRRPRKSAARRARLVLVVERTEPHPAHRPAAHEPKPEPKPEPAPAPAPADTPPAPSEPPVGTPAPPVPEPTPEPPAPPAPPAGALYVSPEGSDAGSGTQSAPWRTLDKALAAARAGDTIVLKAGEYGRLGSINQLSASGADGAPITIMGEPGAGKPALLGYTRITGSHLRLSGLLFDGPTGAVLPKTTSNPKGEEVLVSVMYGSDVEISGSEVRDSAWHAGIYVWDATGVRIVGNRIHDNGDRTDPSQANLDHGIYWAGGSGLVANNVIDHNVAYGVHIYPEANGVTVTQNTIVHSGRGGVIVAAQAANTLVTNNVIADNDLYGIRGYDLTGTGNVARRNLLWQNGSENLSGAGIALSDNIVADPRLGTDLRPLASSPAIDAASPGAVMPVDMDGVARPRGAGPDIGAYEAG